MTPAAIVKEIDKLPFPEKLIVIEKALKAIREEKSHGIKHAVNSLYNDYKTDKELTIFIQLDSEPFYEAR